MSGKLKKPSKKEMCPVGYHVVRGHYRVCQSGTKTWVDAHMRNHHIFATVEQLEDPVVNIAAGVRWFAHKFFLMRKHSDQSLKRVIRNYHSKDKEGDKYAEKVLDYYNKSK